MKTKNSTAMLKEIAEEAEIFSAILAKREEYTRDFVELFKANDIKRMYLTGCGSPGGACIALKYAAVKLLKVDATYSTPGLLNIHEGFNVAGVYEPDEMVLVCPGESGRTKGPVIAARKAREIGIHVVCTTLEPQGVLAQASDIVIFKPSGRELGLPSTKGHSTGIFLLLLCFIEAAHATGKIPDEEYAKYMSGMEHLPAAVIDAYDKTLAWFDEHMDLLMGAARFHLIGYGANYATVNEIVLKFIESHRRPATAVELEEFMHGHIRSITPEELLVFICAEDGPEKERMCKLYELMVEQNVGAGSVMIHSSNDDFHYPGELAFDASNVEFVNSVEYLVPLQIFSYVIADHLGLDMSISQGLYLKKAMEPSFTN